MHFFMHSSHVRGVYYMWVINFMRLVTLPLCVIVNLSSKNVISYTVFCIQIKLCSNKYLLYPDSKNLMPSFMN